MNFDIIDFRLHDIDSTANFSIKKDLDLAAFLIKVFDRTVSFSHLLSIFHWSNKNVGNWDNIPEELFLNNSFTTPLSILEKEHGFDILQKINTELNFIGKNFVNPGIALEDGCGLGFFISGFSSYFDKVIVFDFSMSYLVLAKKMAQELGVNNIEFICGSAEKLPFKSSSFDFIHSNNVIEHVSNPNALFSEASRCISSSGIVYVQSPNRFSAYIEPHFNLPFFGFIPKFISRKIINFTQNRSINDVNLHSLSEVKFLAQLHFKSGYHLYFLPRLLQKTANSGFIRLFILYCLRSRILGGFFHILLNKVFLFIMPYHNVIGFGNDHRYPE